MVVVMMVRHGLAGGVRLALGCRLGGRATASLGRGGGCNPGSCTAGPGGCGAL